MNFFLLGRLLKYQLFSHHHGGHGIHSPFIFNFFSELIKNKDSLPVVKTVVETRKRLLKDKSYIDVTDLGSGSRYLQGKRRRVSDIARYSSVSRRGAKILATLALQADGKTIIELGTSLGLGTMVLSLSAPKSRVISIEGCHETARLAKSNLEDLNISNASICVGDIGNVLDSILEENSSPGLVFIDANHSEEPLKEYFGLILKHIDEDTVVAIDDIHLNASMERGWQSILGSERISSSIDLFSMGIVFFRKGIARQDYVIRY